MVAINFGAPHRLSHVVGASAASMQKHRRLEMDGQWACEFLTSLSELGWTNSVGKLNRLERLRMNFRYCCRLKCVCGICVVLKELRSLQHLQMVFGECYSLADDSSIGHGLKELNTYST